MCINISLGEAELEIMKVLWNAGEAVNTQYIGEAVKDNNWKRTTISTFLARLTQKGAISCAKQGKLYYYTPLITRKSYAKMQTKNLIANLYNGSAKELATALFEDKKLSQRDIEELREMFVSAED